MKIEADTSYNKLIVPSRRSFIAGVAAMLATPAIVRASSLMKVVAPENEFVVIDNATGQVIYRYGWHRPAAWQTGYIGNGVWRPHNESLAMSLTFDVARAA